MTYTLTVNSTERGVGKTAFALATAEIARERGHDVGYMKPKGTRVRGTHGRTLDDDAVVARDLLDLRHDVDTIEPVVYSATLMEDVLRGDTEPEELRRRVGESHREIAGDADLVVVEGGSDYRTGRVVDLADPEVTKLVDGAAVVLSGYRSVQDVDPALEAYHRFGEAADKLVFNGVRTEFRGFVGDEIAAYLGPEVSVDSLPYRREISGWRPLEVFDEIGAEPLTSVDADVYLERYLVGATSGEVALSTFRRTSNAVVVTGGDRHDVQVAALESPGVDCLLLTGGVRPDGMVVSRAEELGVPVGYLEATTGEAVERVEALLREGRKPGREVVDAMKELMTEHLAVDDLMP